jgi:protein-tyrosine phosphatase
MICAYQIILLQRSVAEAWDRFSSIYFPEYRDASFGLCDYYCSIPQCLRAISRSMSLNWYDYYKFDLKAYEHYSDIKNGDISWIIPKKLLIFSNPSLNSIDSYAATFKSLGVTAVIRLNKKNYASERFKKQGIRHYDLEFVDKNFPSEAVVRKFFKIVEKEPGAVAVHCRTGLGKSATLVACYAMKHYEYPSAEIIPWIRMCRPGSILGHQQFFLMEIEESCFKLGQAYRKSIGKSNIFGGSNLEEKVIFRRKSLDTRFNEKYHKRVTEKGQTKMLLSAKLNHQESLKSVDRKFDMSPPANYRANASSAMRNTFFNSKNFFGKEYVSIRLASPNRRSNTYIL